MNICLVISFKFGVTFHYCFAVIYLEETQDSLWANLNPKESWLKKIFMVPYTTKQFPEWNWKHSIKRKEPTFSPPTFINPPRPGVYSSQDPLVFSVGHTNPPLGFAIFSFSSCSQSTSLLCFVKWSCVRSCLHGAHW